MGEGRAGRTEVPSETNMIGRDTKTLGVTCTCCRPLGDSVARQLDEIEAGLKAVENEILDLLRQVME